MKFPRGLKLELDALFEDQGVSWTVIEDMVSNVQQIVCAEFHILEILNCELATPTPAAGIEIFERRLPLWEEQQLQQPFPPHIPLAPPIVFADGAHLIAEVYVQDHFYSANSTASQIGASAWFMSVAFSRSTTAPDKEHLELP